MFRHRSITRKLLTVILITSGAVVLLTCGAFLVYELLTYPQAMVRSLSTLAKSIAANSTASLAFQNVDDAEKVLSSVAADPHVVAAAIYDPAGKLFASYTNPASGQPTIPDRADRDGYRFDRQSLALYEPVLLDRRRLGTLYLRSDLAAFYERLELYGTVVIGVIAASGILAFVLAMGLQRRITQPVLALARTAQIVSETQDYSARAERFDDDELGSLTDAFNGMLTRVKERDEALRASEEKTRLIVETALDAVVTIDTAGTIVGWSPKAEQMFGWHRTDAVGRQLAETIIPPALRDAHRRGLERFLTTGEGPLLNTRVEVSALHREGHQFPVELSITPVRIGDALSFSAFVRDITERKRIERALLESQQHYQALAESLPNLVWTCRPDGFCDFLSRQWADYTGQSAEAQLGYGWAEHVHPDDRDRVREEWAATVARGTEFDVEFRIRRSDGAYRWFKTRAVPLRDTSGVIVKWFGSNTDFDDLKRSEERLQSQLERLGLLDRLTRAIGARQDIKSILQVVVRSLEDHLPLDFCCVGLYDKADETLVIAHVGAGSESLALELAMSEQARIPIDRNGLSKCVHGHLVHEPELAAVAFPFPQRLAQAGLRSLVAAPLMVESNVFGALIAARRDSPGFSSSECEFIRQLSEHVALASHQAELYAALQRAYDDLRQTQHAVMQQERLKALGQMASGIAHDINNAISPVTLYTETLLENEPHLSTRARDYLSTIQRAIEDVSETVGRMREFYREREPQLSLVPMSINRLVGEVVTLTRARWNDMPQERGIVIRLSTDLAPGEPKALGLESEIREALINVIFNAVDAMPDGGDLTIRTRSIEEAGARGASTRVGAQIEVTDTGVGMDADILRRCMEPFFTTKGERGTGLGLAMVYGIVQRHNAEIEIDSAPGRGTTVRLILPSPADGTMAAEAKSDVARSPRLRILLVDDDPVLLKSLRDVLEADGHVVVTANGGQAGIELFDAARRGGPPFGMVITDLGMPYVDGRIVASSVKGTDANTPVILLTGWGQRLVDDGAVPTHVDRVLNKPPKLAELRRALFELSSLRSS